MWMIAAYRRTQPKSIGLVWGLVATWRWVYIHHMNRMNSRNGTTPWWQHHKYRRGIIIIIIIIIIIVLTGTCVSVCACVHKITEKLLTGNWCNLVGMCVLWWSLKVIQLFLTFDLHFWPWHLFLYFYWWRQEGHLISFEFSYPKITAECRVYVPLSYAILLLFILEGMLVGFALLCMCSLLVSCLYVLGGWWSNAGCYED